MVKSGRLCHLTRYLFASVLLLYLVFPYLRSHSPEYVRGHYAEILRTFQDDKKLFVADILQNEVGGEMDGSALASLCASKAWFPESQAVILSCEPVPGGIGAVKNGQLNCIRFAIEIGGPYLFPRPKRWSLAHRLSAGADLKITAQLVLPRMHQRSPGDITNLQGGQTSKGLSLDYMFSTSHLVTALHTHCPQLKVHDSLDALYDKPSLLKPLSFTLNQLTDAFTTVDDTPTTILARPDTLRAQFLAFMDRELPIERRRYPVRAHLGNTLFAWPTFNETGAAFRVDFGKLLRVRDDIKVLAASALWNLAKAHGVALPNPQTGFSSSSSDAAEGFVGIHLRTEADARNGAGSWPPYHDQVPYYFAFLQNHPTGAAAAATRVVFLATGLTAKDDDVKRFRAYAAELNATVVVKRDLLDAAEVSVLNRLSWDQRALLDYEILLRAGTVLGIVESSFAWNVALRRGLAYGTVESEAFMTRPGGEAFVSGGSDKTELVMWRDRWSRLFGRVDQAVGMYLGTWP